jgi:hypothetical protein
MTITENKYAMLDGLEVVVRGADGTCVAIISHDVGGAWFVNTIATQGRRPAKFRTRAAALASIAA